MLEKLLDAISRRTTLLDEARRDAVMMLASVRRMYDLVVLGLKEDAGEEVRAKIMAMDKDINRQQEKVRKKVFEHLSFSRGQDLQQGLGLITAVIDIERIGDYTKNIAELIDFVPHKLNFSTHEAAYKEAQSQCSEVFDRGLEAYSTQDVFVGRKCIESYQRLSLVCDRTIKLLLEETSSSEGNAIDRDMLALVLLLRYLKRVGAHLKNTSSILVNPFHTVGFRPK
jgi:phosphate transport system protein